MTETAIKRCVACQAVTPRTVFESLRMTQLPKEPWCELAADFYGPLPSGDYLLVIIDEYSRFPIVRIVKSTSANTIIPVIDDIFATFGIPDILKSDNGPPFNSGQLQSYAEHMGFTHRKVTPYCHRANGDAERFMKNLGKIIRAASSEGKPWKQELNKFLCNYRATPHITTGVSPAIALFGRQPKIKLPALPRPSNDDQIRKRDAKSKVQMEAYADKHNHARACSYKKGDAVRS